MESLNNLIILSGSFAALVLLFAQFFFKPAKKTTARPVNAVKTQSPMIFKTLISKFRQIDTMVDSLRTQKNVELLKSEVESLKNYVADIEASIIEKIKMKDNEKLQLKAQVTLINTKIESAFVHLTEDESKLAYNKQLLESKIHTFEEKESSEIKTINNDIENLKSILSDYSARFKTMNTEVLSNEVKALSSEMAILENNYEISKEKFSLNLSTKDTDIIKLNEEFIKIKEEKAAVLDIIHKRKRLLENEIQQLKHKYDQEIQRSLKEKEDKKTEIENLNQAITTTEKENKAIENLITLRTGLEKQIADLTKRIKEQERSHLNSIEEKNEILKTLSVSAQEKENEISKRYEEERQKTLLEQIELENEIKRLNENCDKLKNTSIAAESALKEEVEKLQKAYRQNEGKYQNAKKGRLKVEQGIHDKLKIQLDELQKDIETKTADYKNELKTREEQVYILRTRLGIREDKLLSDIQRRRDLQAKIIEDLKVTGDKLRKTTQGTTEKYSRNVDAVSKKVESIKSDVASVDAFIKQEELLSNKLEAQRKKIENEIAIIEDKLTRDLHDMKEFITMKNRQIKMLSEEIIEKENLLRAEHTALGKIVHSTVELKTQKSKIGLEKE